MAEKTHSPSHVIERENKGKNPTEQLNLHDYKTLFSPKQQPRGNKDKTKETWRTWTTIPVQNQKMLLNHLVHAT